MVISEVIAFILCSASINSGIVKEFCFGPAMCTVPIGGKNCLNQSFGGMRTRISGNTFVVTPHLLNQRFMNTWKETVIYTP